MTFLRICPICGREYQARRSTSKYCSATCRSKARNLYPMPDMDAPAIVFVMTADELANVVQDAHRVTDDLGRASEHAPEPVCGKLRRCAEGFADVLGREGL